MSATQLEAPAGLFCAHVAATVMVGEINRAKVLATGEVANTIVVW